MAKTSATSGGATLLDGPQADFYRPPADREAVARSPRIDRAPSGTEDDEEKPFLRTRRRVPVRQGLLPPWARTRWGMIVLGAAGLAVLGAGFTVILAARNFIDRDPRFRIGSAAAIQTVGNSELTRDDLLSVFGGDIGHNLFRVPLSLRRAELERFSWVESATVMRVLPNQLRVAVRERTPIAFVQVHGRIELADAAGVILEMTPQEMAARHYSFPVVNGINPQDPLSARAIRMQAYQKFLSDLDAGGAKFSAQLSEIDVSDPEDVRTTVSSDGTDIQLQFGQENYLARWQNYKDHIAQWRQQYPKLMAVDLRYEHEVVLKMTPDPPAAPPSPASAKASGAVLAAKKKTEASRPRTATKVHAQNTKHAGRSAR